MALDIANTRHTDILIIGSGPAGWTAALYGARAMRKTLVVTGIQPGGQLTITTEVENYPGFSAIQGPDLMIRMQDHALQMGAQVAEDHIASVDFDVRPFNAVGESGTLYTADTVIVATGAQARWLGLPSEKKFQGFGVSACATCDGFFYRGKQVVVVGGGNTAVEEALFLTNFASKVTIIHRRDSFRAERVLQHRLFNNPKIEIVWNSEIDEILGDQEPLSVTGARIRSRSTGEITDIPAHGVFIAIGHAPATDLLRGKLEMNPDGYLITTAKSTATNVPGVFAAGDVADDVFRQAITAAGLGCMAALEAVRMLEKPAHSGGLPLPTRD